MFRGVIIENQNFTKIAVTKVSQHNQKSVQLCANRRQVQISTSFAGHEQEDGPPDLQQGVVSSEGRGQSEKKGLLLERISSQPGQEAVGLT